MSTVFECPVHYSSLPNSLSVRATRARLIACGSLQATCFKQNILARFGVRRKKNKGFRNCDSLGKNTDNGCGNQQIIIIHVGIPIVVRIKANTLYNATSGTEIIELR